MAREVRYITAEKGRDKGRVYEITEMSAYDTERWAMRALFALANAGVDIGEVDAADGFAGIAQLGLAALQQLPFEAVTPLMDSMFQCVKFSPKPGVDARDLVDNDIEEVSTRVMLRGEIFKLHMAPFLDGAPAKA